MPNIFNICYTKHFHLLTLNVRFSQTSLLLVLKFKNYFAVRGKTERIYEHKMITFSLKENKQNQRELFKFRHGSEVDGIGEQNDKAEVTRSTIELSLPFKSLPAYIKVKSTCSSKFVASSVPFLHIFSRSTFALINLHVRPLLQSLLRLRCAK